jgi:hypothetical protein
MPPTARLTLLCLLVPMILLVLMPIPVRGSDVKGKYGALGLG